MVKSILHNICEHLRAVDAAPKVRFSCDIYSSGKNPFSERMGREFLTAFIVRNHLGMSGGPSKYVEFRHRTLLLYAKHPWRGSRRLRRESSAALTWCGCGIGEYPPENSATTGAIKFLSGDAGAAAGSESTQNPPVRTFRSFEAEAQWLIR
jgi:hypothetical protein